MKVSLNWLKNYIELKSTPEELANTLTMAGLEVEEITRRGEIPAGVVVAKILSREKHPNSDHLSICRVDAGNGNVYQIVCGADRFACGTVRRGSLRVRTRRELFNRRHRRIRLDESGVEPQLRIQCNTSGILQFARILRNRARYVERQGYDAERR